MKEVWAILDKDGDLFWDDFLGVFAIFTRESTARLTFNNNPLAFGGGKVCKVRLKFSEVGDNDEIKQ